jgi:replicative DNA helicase
VANDDDLAVFVQQDLLTVLSFSDEYALIIRGAVSLDMFQDDNKVIATGIYKYIDQYKESPKDHLPDLFEDILLNTKDDRSRRRARTIKRLIDAIQEHQEGVNIKYTMDRLDRFIRHQEIRKATLTVLDEFKDGKLTDEGIVRAEEIFSDALRKKSTVFNPGIALGDSEKSLAFLHEEEQDIFRTGIPELDDEDLGPKRGALHLFVGLPKHGKTWWLIHLGKEAFLHGHKVLHISLEMGEDQISRRYHQSIYHIARRRTVKELQRTKLVFGATSGEFKRYRMESFTPRHTLDDKDIYKYLLDKHRRSRKKLDNVRVKAFPTGQLTMVELEAYLNTLELQEGFIPDLLLIDYPQLMKLGAPQFQRLELGKIVQNLRGLAVERNMAVAAVSQSSRKGINSESSQDGNSLITMEHIAEDFSQVMTVDVMLTFNQTRAEKGVNLARIYVAAARDQESDFVVQITPQYNTGQFCGHSYRMRGNSFKTLQEFLKGSSDSEEDDE